RGVSKQKWLEDRKRKIGKLLDANGLDMTKAYMLDTQEAAEEKYKKWDKDPAPFGWDGMFFNICPRTVIAQSISMLIF
ncbi:pre-mRNA-splicing factor SYF2-like, partial [Trifolium medium]|nr:pre-mRNA-splicing factor SYF2-like [Trifolium medium]